MSGKEYLESILSKYAITTGDNSPAILAARKVAPYIQKWAGEYLVEIKLSGSYAKGTAIKGQTDIDIFVSIRNDCANTLGDIFNSMFDMFNKYDVGVRKQNVSIGITVDSQKIDIVPAKKQGTVGGDHSLYLRKQNTWTKTNIDTHITIVSKSGRTEEIRLLKVWRKLNNLDFPSIYLELIALEALKYRTIGDLENNFLAVLKYIQNNIQSVAITDPSNTSNIISSDSTFAEKAAISNAAKNSTSKEYWKDIVW